MRKFIGISMFAAVMALSLAIPAHADGSHDSDYITATNAVQFDHIAIAAMPTLPADAAIVAADTVATYTQNASIPMAGVVLAFRDFRNGADSGGDVR